MGESVAAMLRVSRTTEQRKQREVQLGTMISPGAHLDDMGDEGLLAAGMAGILSLQWRQSVSRKFDLRAAHVGWTSTG